MLADMLGVTRQTLHRWETGRSPVPDYLHGRLRRLAADLARHPAAAPAKPIGSVEVVNLNSRRAYYIVRYEDGSKFGPTDWRWLPLEAKRKLWGWRK